MAWCAIGSFGGGLLAGDEVDMAVEVQPHAALTLVTQDKVFNKSAWQKTQNTLKSQDLPLAGFHEGLSNRPRCQSSSASYCHHREWRTLGACPRSFGPVRKFEARPQHVYNSPVVVMVILRV